MMPAAGPKGLALRVLRCCASSKKAVKNDIHTTLFDAGTVSWKNMSNGLDFVTQAWRWLTNALLSMIQTPFTDGTGSGVK